MILRHHPCRGKSLTRRLFSLSQLLHSHGMSQEYQAEAMAKLAVDTLLDKIARSTTS
jgi:hypothetical protein